LSGLGFGKPQKKKPKNGKLITRRDQGPKKETGKIDKGLCSPKTDGSGAGTLGKGGKKKKESREDKKHLTSKKKKGGKKGKKGVSDYTGSGGKGQVKKKK